MRATIKRYLILLLLIIPVIVRAQTNYTALNGPSTGTPSKIVSVNGVLIGIVNGGGIYRSADAGATWTRSNNGITNLFLTDITVDVTANKVLAVSATELFISSDDGLSWFTAANAGFSNARFVRRSSNANLYIVGHTGVVYRSTNGGTTWSVRYASLPANTVTDVEINELGHLFVMQEGAGVHRSIDNGFSFTLRNTGLENLNAYSLLIDGATLYLITSTAVYKSVDNGANWANTNGIAPTNITDCCFTSFTSVEKDPAGNIYITNDQFMWKSTDAGATWAGIKSPIPVGLQGQQALPYFVSDTEFFFGVHKVSLYKTIDGGNTWQHSNNGIFANDNTDIIIPSNGANSILQVNPGTYGIYRSADDGSTWTLQATGATAYQFTGLKRWGTNTYAHGNALSLSSNNGATWALRNEGDWHNFATGNTSLYVLALTSVEGVYTVKYSANGATSVGTVPTIGMPSANTSNLPNHDDIFADASNNLYVLLYDYTEGVNNYRIFYINSTTGVATEIINLPIANSEFRDIFFLNNKLYVLAANNQLYISTDGGVNWSAKAVPNDNNRLKVISDNTFYVFNTSIYLSTDGGDNWTNTDSFSDLTANQPVSDVEVSASNYAYVALPSQPVYKSIDLVVPPNAPTALSVENYSAYSLSLKWTDNSNNESYFLIERSDGNNTNYDSVAFSAASGIGSRVVNVDVPVANALYYFRVRAVNVAGKSAYTSEASVTTLQDCQGPPIPLNRSWTATTQTIAGSNTPVTITGSAGKYIIEGLLNTNAVAGISPTVSTSATFQIAEVCGDVYLFPGTAMYGNGTWDANSHTLSVFWETNPHYIPYRSETTIYTLNEVDPAPGTPANLTAYVNAENAIVLQWTAALYAQSYQVQRSLTSNANFENIGAPLTTTNFTDNTITFAPGTTYYYRIVATNFNGLTTNSTQLAFTYAVPRFVPISLSGSNFLTWSTAWIDLDNDNDEDLLLGHSNNPAQPLSIFENDGAGNLTKIYLPGVSNFVAPSMRAVAAGDINNDGYTDFTLRGSLSSTPEIFINKGNKSFTSIDLPQLSGLSANHHTSLADFNNDGRLDAVFTNGGGTQYKFFTQNSEGQFVPYTLGEIAAVSGVFYAGSWADYDNDGDQDFLMGNNNTGTADFDRLFTNNGDATFTPVSSTVFEQDYAMSPRSMSWGDYDNDLDLDLYITHSSSNLPNMLYQNNGDGTFSRMPLSLPAETKNWGSDGSAWGDMDNDGDLDLVVANDKEIALYSNEGLNNFSKHLAMSYGSTYSNFNVIGLSLADYDNNGTLDIAPALYVAYSPMLLKNKHLVDENSRWLKVKLEGTVSNRSAIGARIIVTTPDQKKQMRTIESRTGYAGAGSLTAHIGLATNTTATVEVFWPSGIHQTVHGVTANQTLTIVEDIVSPQLLSISPTNGSSNVSASGKLILTLNEASLPVAGKLLRIAPVSEPENFVASLDVNDAVKTDNSYEFTLPAKLSQSTAYQVSLDADAFTDMSGNTLPALAPEDWTFTTGNGPQLQSLSPLHQATVVATTQALTLSFDVAITPVAGKKIRVMDADQVLLDEEVTTGNVADKTITFAAPVAGWPYNRSLSVILDEGALTDAVGNESEGITAGTWVFTTNTGLSPQTLSPLHQSSAVPIMQSIVLSFKVAVTPVAGKKIRVMDGAAILLDAEVNSGDLTVGTVEFRAPATGWPYDRTLSVTIDEHAFTDAAGNSFAGIKPGAWTFITDPGIKLVSYTPLNGAIAVSTLQPIVLNFNVAISPVAGKKLRVMDGSATFLDVDVTTGDVADKSITFAAPASGWPYSRNLSVVLDDAALTDAIGNESKGISTGVWKFTTNTGLPIQSLSPLHQSTSVSADQALTLNFNVTVTPVAGKKLRVMDSSTTLLDVDVTTGDVADKAITFAAPATGWPYESMLAVIIDEHAFTDAVNNQFAGIKNGMWLFTTADAPDEEAPLIIYDPNPVSVLDKNFAPVNLSITATDNKGVISLKLYNRKIAENNFNEIAATKVTDENWTVQLNNSMADDMGLEYYFVATDLAGNTKRSPEITTDYYKTRTRFTATHTPQLTLTGEGIMSGWKIISVPYQLNGDNYAIADVFQSFGAASENTWRLIRYNKTGNKESWSEYPAFATLERGKGYFINAKGARETLFTNATSPDYDRNNLFSMSLTQGWNQIGNPYSIAINWNEVRSFNNASATVGELRIFTSGQYASAIILQPQQGAFVYAQSAITLQIPFAGQTVASRVRTTDTFTTDLTSSNWHLPLVLEHGYITNTFPGIGMHTAASLGIDEFDDINPPRFFDYAEFNVKHAEHTSKEFTRDIVPVLPYYEWDFTVNTNQHDRATLRWDNTILKGDGKELMLLDDRTMTFVNMREANQYIFDPYQSAHLKIYFGENLKEKITSAGFEVAGVYPNPASGETQVRFSLPDGGGEAQQVLITASDVRGRSLGSVTTGVFGGGYHSLSFNASALKSKYGLVILTIEVFNRQGRSTKQVKVFINN